MMQNNSMIYLILQIKENYFKILLKGFSDVDKMKNTLAIQCILFQKNSNWFSNLIEKINSDPLLKVNLYQPDKTKNQNFDFEFGKLTQICICNGTDLLPSFLQRLKIFESILLKHNFADFLTSEKIEMQIVDKRWI